MKKILIMLVISAIMLTGCSIQSPATEIIDNSNIQSSETLADISVDTLEVVSGGIKDFEENQETISDNLSNETIVDVITNETEAIEVEITVPEEIIVPEITETISTYKITDIELSGRDITTYGEFNQEKIEDLEKILDAYNKNISVAAYSLDGSKAIVYNGNQEYFSACTVKIPWMIYLCREIDAGRVDKDTVITYEEKHYHKGSGTIRKGSYGDQYTIEELINLCLSISDNVAYEMLVQEVIDRDDFYKYIESLNMDRFMIPSYSIWCSNAIPTDFLIIWEDVYNYLKLETTGSKILKTACTNTIWNYGTATLIDYDYSHKSGDNWEPNAAHNDAGIVWSNSPYVYAIFTKSEGNDYDERTIDAVMGLIHEEFCE